jgi:hypothetical protein
VPIGWGFQSQVEQALVSCQWRFDLIGRNLRPFLSEADGILRHAIQRGVRVRFLLLDPESSLAQDERHLSLAVAEAARRLAVEIRFTSRPIVPATARVDDLCLVDLTPDAGSPLRLTTEGAVLRLTKRGGGEVFEAYTDAFERAWSEADADEARSQWPDVRASLVRAMVATDGSRAGRELAAAGFEVESAVLRVFEALPDFEVTMESASRGDPGFDAVAFDLSTGEQFLVQVKATRNPLTRHVVQNLTSTFERYATQVLLMTAAPLSSPARTMMADLRQSGFLIAAVTLHDLAECQTAEEAAGLMRQALV